MKYATKPYAGWSVERTFGVGEFRGQPMALFVRPGHVPEPTTSDLLEEIQQIAKTLKPANRPTIVGFDGHVVAVIDPFWVIRRMVLEKGAYEIPTKWERIKAAPADEQRDFFK